jgi:hypothetical protein
MINLTQLNLRSYAQMLCLFRKENEDLQKKLQDCDVAMIAIWTIFCQAQPKLQVKHGLKAELALLSLLYQHPPTTTRNSCFLS